MSDVLLGGQEQPVMPTSTSALLLRFWSPALAFRSGTKHLHALKMSVGFVETGVVLTIAFWEQTNTFLPTMVGIGFLIPRTLVAFTGPLLLALK